MCLFLKQSGFQLDRIWMSACVLWWWFVRVYEVEVFFNLMSFMLPLLEWSKGSWRRHALRSGFVIEFLFSMKLFGFAFELAFPVLFLLLVFQRVNSYSPLYSKGFLQGSLSSITDGFWMILHRCVGSFENLNSLWSSSYSLFHLVGGGLVMLRTLL